MTGCVRPARNAAGRQGREWDVIIDLGKQKEAAAKIDGLFGNGQ